MQKEVMAEGGKVGRRAEDPTVKQEGKLCSQGRGDLLGKAGYTPS